MVKIHIKVHEDDPLSIEGLTEKVANNVAIDLLANLKKESPVDHGRLQGSWSIFDDGPAQRVVKSSAIYADYVNSGTGIYGPYKTPITHPTIGEQFAFQANGRMIYTNMIKGIKPRKFVEKSIGQTEKRLPELVMISVNKAKS